MQGIAQVPLNFSSQQVGVADAESGAWQAEVETDAGNAHAAVLLSAMLNRPTLLHPRASFMTQRSIWAHALCTLARQE